MEEQEKMPGKKPVRSDNILLSGGAVLLAALFIAHVFGAFSTTFWQNLLVSQLNVPYTPTPRQVYDFQMGDDYYEPYVPGGEIALPDFGAGARGVSAAQRAQEANGTQAQGLPYFQLMGGTGILAADGTVVETKTLNALRAIQGGGLYNQYPFHYSPADDCYYFRQESDEDNLLSAVYADGSVETISEDGYMVRLAAGNRAVYYLEENPYENEGSNSSEKIFSLYCHTGGQTHLLSSAVAGYAVSANQQWVAFCDGYYLYLGESGKAARCVLEYDKTGWESTVYPLGVSDDGQTIYYYNPNDGTEYEPMVYALDVKSGDVRNAPVGEYVSFDTELILSLDGSEALLCGNEGMYRFTKGGEVLPVTSGPAQLCTGAGLVQSTGDDFREPFPCSSQALEDFSAFFYKEGDNAFSGMLYWYDGGENHFIAEDVGQALVDEMDTRVTFKHGRALARWSVGGELQLLAENTVRFTMSGDGSTVFYEKYTRLPDDPDEPDVISAYATFYRLVPGQAAEEVCVGEISTMLVTLDGSTLFYTIYGDDETMYVYTPGGGSVPLEGSYITSLRVSGTDHFLFFFEKGGVLSALRWDGGQLVPQAL